jgi:DNA polymerase-1
LSRASWLGGHNILTYDLEVLKKLHGFVTTAEIFDSLVVARLIWSDSKALKAGDWTLARRGRLPQFLIGRHGLKAWGYRLGVLKGEFGETADWKAWTPEMHLYCKQDVAVNVKLIEKQFEKLYSPEAIKLEHDYQQIIFEQEKVGVKFNIAKAVKLQSTLVKRKDELTEQLRAVFPPRIEVMKTPAYYVGYRGNTPHRYSTKGAAKQDKAQDIIPGPMREKIHPFNPGSRDEIAERLIERGWKPEKMTDGGKPSIDDDILEEAVEQIDLPEIKLLGEFLMVKKRLGQLAEGKEAWLKVEKNGRIYGQVVTNGAVTGRCTHKHPNLAQVPKVTNPYGPECRGLFEADDDRVMIGADASGLELRCLAHFLGRYDDGAYGRIVTEGDVHTANQIAAGLPAGKAGRDMAKTMIYGLMYGAGNAKLGRIVAGTAADGLRLRKRFLDGLPAYAQLVADIGNVVVRKGVLKGLDGRLLPVRSPHSALNTLLQSAGALVMKKATVILHERLRAEGFVLGKDYDQLLSIHDEWQFQARPEIAERVGQLAVQAIKEAGEYFSFRVPLSGEFKIGKNWAETH